MGLFDFLKKKKDEDFMDLGSPSAGGIGGGFGPSGARQSARPEYADMGGMGELPGMPAQQPYPQQGGQGIDVLREQVQTLGYKVDALKSSLDSINARLANIEQMLRGGQGQQQGWNY